MSVARPGSRVPRIPARPSAAGCPSASSGAGCPSRAANPNRLSSTCSRLRGSMRCVGEQPLQFARPGAVETQLDARRDHRRRETGAQGELHVQQRVETPAGEAATQAAEGRQARHVLSNATNSMPGMWPSSLCSSLPRIQVSRGAGHSSCSVRTTGSTWQTSPSADRRSTQRCCRAESGRDRARHAVRAVGRGGPMVNNPRRIERARNRERGPGRRRALRAARCYTMPRGSASRALRCSSASTGDSWRARGGRGRSRHHRIRAHDAGRAGCCATIAAADGSCTCWTMPTSGPARPDAARRAGIPAAAPAARVAVAGAGAGRGALSRATGSCIART